MSRGTPRMLTIRQHVAALAVKDMPADQSRVFAGHPALLYPLPDMGFVDLLGPPKEGG